MRPEHISVWTVLNLYLGVCFLAPLHILRACACVVLVMIVIAQWHENQVLSEDTSAHSLEESIRQRRRETNPLLPSVFSAFPIFQYADRCLQNLAYLHMTPGTPLYPEKTSTVQFSAQLSDSTATVWLLLAHNKMIIFILSSTLCSAFDAHQYLNIWKLTDSARVVTVPL